MPENRVATAEAVIQHKADMGIAWNRDFDCCFLFAENDGFVDGYYIVDLLVESILQRNLGAYIVHDPRLLPVALPCRVSRDAPLSKRKCARSMASMAAT